MYLIRYLHDEIVDITYTPKQSEQKNPYDYIPLENINVPNKEY